MEIREKIAEIDTKIAELRELQNEIKIRLGNTENADQEKIGKLEKLFAEKLGQAPESDPRKQAVLQKITALKSECEQKQQELRDDIQTYENQIEELLDQSAKLTKEMLSMIE